MAPLTTGKPYMNYILVLLQVPASVVIQMNYM